MIKLLIYLQGDICFILMGMEIIFVRISTKKYEEKYQNEYDEVLLVKRKCDEQLLFKLHIKNIQNIYDQLEKSI